MRVKQRQVHAHKAKASAAENVSPAPHRWTKYGTVFAILVSLGSLYISWANYIQTKRTNHSNVKPDLFFTVRHNTLPQNTNSAYAAELVILNKGPIKAISVYTSYQVFDVDTNFWWPYGGVAISESLHNEYTFMLREIDAGDGKVKSILAVGPVAIYVVDVSYYHPNDMTKYSSREIFLYDSGNFYDEVEFRQKPYYSILKKNLLHRLANEKSELLPGQTLPKQGEEKSPEFDLFVPDDKEEARPLE